MLRLGLLITVLTLAVASPASAGELGLSSDIYEWIGTDSAETVNVAPTVSGYTLTSNQTITVLQSADAKCGPSGMTVVCSSTGIGAVSLFGNGGGDILTMELSAAGEPKAALFVYGGSGNDTITGGSDDDIIYADGDNDTVHGRDGNDSVHGDAGVDTVNGNAGNDWVTGDEDADTISGAAGNDQVFGGDGVDSIEAGSGDDVVDGGTGNEGTLDGGTHVFGDTVRYLDRDAGVTANITTTTGSDGDAGEDAVNFEKLVGSHKNDDLYGGAGADSIDGAGGDDMINGMGGADVLMGGWDEDTILGGTGNDDIQGDNGDDILDGGANNDFVNGNNDNDRFVAEPGSDALDGGNGTDTADYSARNEVIAVSIDGMASFNDGGASDDTDGGGPLTARDTVGNVEVVKGGPQNDVLNANGHTAAMQLFGNDGNDELTGGTKADTLDGGNGNDTLFGHGDHDKLTSGAGNDILDGGLGIDTFSAGADADDVRSEDGVFTEKVDCGDGTDKVKPDRYDQRTACEEDTVLAADAAAAKAKQDAYAAEVAARQAKYAADMAARQAAYEAEVARRRAAATALQTSAQRVSSLPLVRAFVSRKFVQVGKRGSRVSRLRLTGLPASARVIVRCVSPKRGSCPQWRVRSLRPRAGAVDVAALFGKRVLAPRTSVQLHVSAANARSRTMRFSIRAGKAPLFSQEA